MRYLVGFALALVASPLSASAQDAEEGTTSEPSLQEPEPSSEPAPDEPALELKLDDAGIVVVPSQPRTADGYTLMEMERRVQRAKIGLGVSVPFILVGTMVAVIASAPDFFQLGETEEEPIEPSPGGIATGIVLGVGGLAGTVASGVLLRKRKRALSELQLAHYGIPARTRRGYTLEEAELRMKRARIGLGVSAGFSVLGLALAIAGRFGDCQFYPFPSRCDPLAIAGFTFIGAGVVGMITTGILSVRRTRDRYWLRREDYETPRRVQWDLARSRLVF
jgi:hypothetical protein